MTVTTNPQMLRDMEAALAEPVDEGNPFIRDGDKTHMRFDEIQIVRVGRMVEVSYRWRGTIAFTQSVPCVLRAGQVLTLAGVQGRMLVRAM